MKHRTANVNSRQTPIVDDEDGHLIQPTADDYKRYLARRSRDGNYFKFFRDYLSVMSLDSALLIQSLNNLGCSSADGWVLCTTSYIESTLHMPRARQDRAFRELRRKGFIAYMRRGIPARRFVRLHLERIDQAIDKVEGINRTNTSDSECTESYKLDGTESHKLNCTKSYDSKSTLKGTPKKKNNVRLAPDDVDSPTDRSEPDRRRPPARGVPPIADETGMPPPTDLFGKRTTPKSIRYTPADMECAERLWNAVIAAQHPKPAARKTTWANQFRLLRESLSVPDADKRIAAVLEWYCRPENLAKAVNGVPVALCAATFRDKFARIAAAQQRAGAAAPAKPPGPDAFAMAERLTNMPWPNNTAEQLPAVIQASMDSVEPFLNRCYRLWKRIEADPYADPRFRHIRYLVSGVGGACEAAFFVEKQFTALRRWLHDKAFSGDLMRFAINVETDRFRAAICAECSRQDQTEYWGDMLAVLGEYEPGEKSQELP